MGLFTDRRVRLRAKLVVCAAGLVAAVSATALFTAASGSSSGGAGTGAAAGPLSKHFALLRKPPSQTPPVNLAAAVRRAPAELGLRLRGARKAASNSAWLIPGTSALCIATYDRAGLGMTCAAQPIADAGELAFVIRGPERSRATIVGAAPDDEPEVVAETATGAKVGRAQVRESTYRLVGRHIARATLTGAAGSVSVGG